MSFLRGHHRTMTAHKQAGNIVQLQALQEQS